MHSFLIADNHYTTRLGLIEIIRSHYTEYTIEESKNGKETFEKLKAQKFDMLITDLGMPETDPNQFVDMALDIQPELKILVLSIGKEGHYAPICLLKGALGYIGKDSGLVELTMAIRTVLNGSVYVGASLVMGFVTGNILKGNPFLTLSVRETEILMMICHGKGLIEIAATKKLGISTVSTYKIRIMKKVGVQNLADLFKMARFHSFLDHYLTGNG